MPCTHKKTLKTIILNTIPSNDFKITNFQSLHHLYEINVRMGTNNAYFSDVSLNVCRNFGIQYISKVMQHEQK